MRENIRGVHARHDGCRTCRRGVRTDIRDTPWEVFDLPRPTPFGLPLFAAFSRETLLAQDPDKALDELVATLYDQWGDEAA